MLKTIDIQFLRDARRQSLKSKDKTKIGAVLVDRFGEMIGEGHNRMPSRFSCEDVDKYLSNRELKNRFIIHAEISCICDSFTYIYNRNSNSCKLYIWGLHSCARCAGFVSDYDQISEIISVDTLTTIDPKMWSEEAQIAQQIYKDAGIEVEHWEKNEFDSFLTEIEKYDYFYAN